MKSRVSKKATGEVLIMEESGFVASLVDGKWSPKILFDAYQLHDFKRINNSKEAAALMQQAHAALAGKKLIKASS